MLLKASSKMLMKLTPDEGSEATERVNFITFFRAAFVPVDLR